jgi:hypothetical protein
MIDVISSKSRQIINKSERVVYTRGKSLRGSIVAVPFICAVAISFIYGRWNFPPWWFQELVVFSTLFFLVIIYHCRSWIYRFQVGTPLLALSFGGVLLFPADVCIHIWEYNVSDNGVGMGMMLVAWGLSTYCLWRLFQPGRNTFWNKILEPFQSDSRRWLILLAYPLIWAGYGFGVFELVDTQFDLSKGRVFQIPVLKKTEHLSVRSGRQFYVGLSRRPWEYNHLPRDEGPQVPEAVFNRLAEGEFACVTLHPGLLGAPWYWLDTCHR